MKILRIVCVALMMGLLSSCTSPPKNNDQLGAAISKAFLEPFAPLYEISLLRNGGVDLIYCSLSFCNKNARWPKDYGELSAFVKQSDGYLMLGEYERANVRPLPNDGLEICYVRLGHTNEVKFTLGSPPARK